MQTKGEAALVDELKQEIRSLYARGESPVILNLGAGDSISIEDQLQSAGFDVICDRVDVEDPTVDHPMAGDALVSPTHAMLDIPTGRYPIVFANYVFEHIFHLEESIEELRRVLKPDGLLVLSVPNPSAPEFLLSARTPLWFHALVRGKRAWEPEYAFRTPRELMQVFERHGFSTISVRQFAHTYSYARRFPGLRGLSKQYDKFVDRRGWTRLMGDACLVFRRKRELSVISSDSTTT